MHEMNDGLRPNYDFMFDEAIQRTVDGDKLKPEHKKALRKFGAGRVLVNGQKIALQHK